MPRTTSRSKSTTKKKVEKAPAKKPASRSTRKTSTASSKSPARSTKAAAKTTKAPAKTTKASTRSSSRSTKAPAKNTKAAAKTTKSTTRAKTPAKNTKSTAKSPKATGTRGRPAKSTAAKSKSPATKGKGRGASKKKADSDDEEEEEEEDTKPTRPGRGRKAAPKKDTKSKATKKVDKKTTKKGKKAAESDDEEEEEEEEEKDDKKGRGKSGKRGRGKSQDDGLDSAAGGADKGGKKKKLDLDNIEVNVDEHCPRSDLNVYIKGSTIYDAKLNQSNVNANNNKFYVIQLLQNKNNKSQFYVFNRWGRVGVPGQTKLMGPMGEDAAVKEYEKKLREKSVKGDYRVLEMDYTKDTTADAAQAMATGLKSSKLKKPVADLVSLIFDTTMANKQMESIGYDTKKLPLGKLSTNNIQKGYKVLKEILDEIQSKNKQSKLAELSNDFYSYIPHDVGFTKMQNFVIKDEETVKKKLDLLDSLSNVKETFALIQKKGDGDNVVDANYKKLKCKIDPLEKGTAEFKMIQNFISNTSEGSKATIINAYEIDREGEDSRYAKKIDNKVLLWHGSRLANFVGILSQGLRIAPPEAPASGYRFGKGIYLADMFSKSYGYCRSWGSDSFCIMLCEGALGTPNELLRDDFNASKLPKGKHSTKALGHIAPHEKHHKEIMKGVVIPQGKPEKTPHNNSACSHNEFIIYDVNQIRIRYLLWMKESR